jgi:hypothetical protein
MFTTLLNKLSRLRRGLNLPRRRASRPSLEALEGRLLLSSTPPAVAAVNYGSGGQYQNVYHVAGDGKLYADSFDPAVGWKQSSLGRPAGVVLAGDPAAINYGSGGQYENVYVRATNGNVYQDAYDPAVGAWKWSALGTPGVALVGGLAVINYGPAGEYENVFARGADGNLYQDAFVPGTGWTWSTLGKPLGALLASDPAVINYGPAGQYENVYLRGADGGLYRDAFVPGSGWTWSSLGKMGASLVGSPAVANYGPAGQYENVYLRGADGNLYQDAFDPGAPGWTWHNLGRPAGVLLASDLAAINYGPAGQYQNVFARGSNGNLYQDAFDPATGAWRWSNLGNPATPLVGSPAAINYGSGGQYENVYLTGADGKLYYDSFDPASGWHWNNVNGETVRVGDVLRGANASAQVGLYLKQVGGPVLADLQGGVQFEPCSAIKALILLTAMQRVKAGTLHLSDPVSFYYKPGDNINNLTKGNPDVNPDSYAHTPANRITETLGKLLERMMERSDNRATQAIEQLVGRPAINATAQLAGMTGTVFASTEGSGVPGNFTTLHDLGLLYEKVMDGTLLGTGAFRDEFRRRMTDENTGDLEDIPFPEGVFGAFVTVVRQEAAAKLHKSQNDPAVAQLTNAFVAKMRNNWKGGSYDLFFGIDSGHARVDRTVGGYVELPFKTDGKITPRGFVYGLFIENAVVPRNGSDDSGPALNQVNQAWSDGQGELLREQIREALATW